MAEVKKSAQSKLNISEDVIVTVARLAALEVKGVAGLDGEITKMSKLRKGLISQIVNNELKEMDTDFLGIDELCDMVLHDDVLLILNHISSVPDDEHHQCPEQVLGRFSGVLRAIVYCLSRFHAKCDCRTMTQLDEFNHQFSCHTSELTHQILDFVPLRRID
jgi:hypothetical protein